MEFSFVLKLKDELIISSCKGFRIGKFRKEQWLTIGDIQARMDGSDEMLSVCASDVELFTFGSDEIIINGKIAIGKEVITDTEGVRSVI